MNPAFLVQGFLMQKIRTGASYFFKRCLGKDDLKLINKKMPKRNPH